MSGGEILNNKTYPTGAGPYHGGGVLVHPSGTFIKLSTGGVIYGNDNPGKANIVTDSVGAPLSNMGQAVYVIGDSYWYNLLIRRESTVTAHEALSVKMRPFPPVYTGYWVDTP
jgi:hypothetical protein